ncbi:MAG: hypothetical protein QM811_07080 [Pirellulales bacterium]
MLSSVAAPVRETWSTSTTKTLAVANTSRRQLIVYNEGTQPVYLKYGTSASATSYTAVVAASGGYWEMPTPIYTGDVTAYSTNGAITMTTEGT